MKRHKILTYVLMSAHFLWIGATYGSDQPIVGERLDPATYGPGVVETMADVMAREHSLARAVPENPSDRNGHQGVWVVPSRRATYSPISGNHNVVNKWGDTCMGIGFGHVVDVVGAYFAGQAGEGAWTTGVRAIGYRDGVETGRTEWFHDIGPSSKWFRMDLRDVDRIVIESQPVLFGGGWYAMDDLTYAVATGNDPDDTETIVVDFDDLPFNTSLGRSGPGYAGLIWETGAGDFNANEAIHFPMVPPGVVQRTPTPGAGAGGVASQVTGRPPDLKLGFQGVIRGEGNSASFPPDTCGAIGPDHYVIVVNRVFSVHDKLTGDRLFVSNLGTFLPGSSGDPRIVFDQHSGRWIILVSDFNTRLYLAVSRTSDPLGAWFKANFLASAGSDAGGFPDYETLGVDAQGIYTAAFMTDETGRMTIFAIDKAPLVAAEPTLGTITAFRELPWEGAIQPVHTYGSPEGEYFVSTSSSSTLRVRRLDPPLTAPTLTEVGFVTIPTFSSPPLVPALGSGTPLDSVGTRLMMAVYRDGAIWTSHAVGFNGRAAARWYQLDPVTVTLVQSGTVTDDFLNFSFPSIAVNDAGDALIAFSGSHAGQYAANYYAGRRASDPAGAMSTPVLLREGDAPQNNIDGFGRNRWGDYSLTTLDPEDEQTLWTIQEYAHATNVWGTYVGAMGFGDCDGDGLRDECALDCGQPGGECDLPGCGVANDCNGNGIPDACEIAETSNAPGGPFFCRAACDPDCNRNAIPDDCEALPDCNANGHADQCDVAGVVYAVTSPRFSPIGGQAVANFEIMDPPTADGDVAFTFSTIADLSQSNEWIDVVVNGVNVGRLFEENGNICPATPDRADVAVPAEVFNAHFGIVTVGMVPNAAVEAALCGQNSFIRANVEYITKSADANGDEIPDECQECQGDAECVNADACSVGRCIDQVCVAVPKRYGDIAGNGGVCGSDGQVDLADIIAVLDGFGAQFAAGCTMADIDVAGDQGSCVPNGGIDLFDILAVLNAFEGIDPCCAGAR